MITETLCVTATCDGCRDTFGTDEIDTHFSSADAAVEYLTEEEGWGTVGDRLLCSNCSDCCRTGDHRWRELTAPPGVFGDDQMEAEVFRVCGRCEQIERPLFQFEGGVSTPQLR